MVSQGWCERLSTGFSFTDYFSESLEFTIEGGGLNEEPDRGGTLRNWVP